jgi:hypothetical protein
MDSEKDDDVSRPIDRTVFEVSALVVAIVVGILLILFA